MRKFWCALVLSGIFSVAAGAPRAAADQAFLQDGSLLVGTVKQFAEGALKIETSFGGELTVPADQLAGLSTEGAFVVRLNSGEIMTGSLHFADGAQGIALDQNEHAPLALGDVASIVPEGQELPPVEEAPAEAPPEEPKASWSGRAELGLNGHSGNKERFDARLGIDVQRTTELTRLTLYLKGQYAESNSERSANEMMGGARLEYDFSERTYVFGKIDLEYDEFENLDLRTTLTGGFGHFFIQREKVELKGWAGVGYEHELFDQDDVEGSGDIAATTSIETAVRDAVRLAVRDEIVRLFEGGSEDTTMSEVVVELGYNYRHDFHKNFRFEHGLTYYPAIDDPTRDYRLAVETALEFPLGKDPDWTLRTGVRHEYDAMPQEGVDELDTTYYLNLGYNF